MTGYDDRTDFTRGPGEGQGLARVLCFDDDDAVGAAHAVDRDVTRILERCDRLDVPRIDPRQRAAGAHLDLGAVDDEQGTLGRVPERGCAHHADDDTAALPSSNRHAGQLPGEHLSERPRRRIAIRDALDRRGWRWRQRRARLRAFGAAVTACDAQHSKSDTGKVRLFHSSLLCHDYLVSTTLIRVPLKVWSPESVFLATVQGMSRTNVSTAGMSNVIVLPVSVQSPIKSRSKSPPPSAAPGMNKCPVVTPNGPREIVMVPPRCTQLIVPLVSVVSNVRRL